MFLLFFCFVVFSIACLSFTCNDLGGFLSIINLGFNGSHWNFFYNFDFIVLSILLMLFVCFGYAFFYTDHYFSFSKEGKNLRLIICLFVAVMASLVVTGDFLLTLIFWEYLGVVSFFLILFYLNYVSLRASIVTLVSSRFGDVCLFLLLAVSMYNKFNSVFMCILISLVVLTKSASFPFISWLLEAMRAPTPVSSLVHSSTLVAAGVWFSLRYDISLYTNNLIFIVAVLLLTIFITGFCCLSFLDLKKIVALSTCNNISWCILYLILGDQLLCLFQLLSHGVSKCLLFMLVGDVMSGSGGSQASNCVYSSQLYGSWGIFSLFSIILGLSGAPFIGVFFTKHLLLSVFFSMVNMPLLIVTMTCVLLSYLYSFRLCRVLYNVNVSSNAGVFFCFSSGLMVYFWLFINFILSSLLEETNFVNSSTSIILLIFQFLACVFTYWLYNSSILGSWSSSLWGCDNLVESIILFYNSVIKFMMLFFFRWDSYVLQIFNFNGVSVINIYKQNLLNILFIALMIFILMCLLIV